MLKIIRASLWGTEPGEVSRTVFEELNTHSIAALPANILSGLELPMDLRNEWKRVILRQVIHYSNYVKVQSCLPVHVPYVILKGTAAAKYYPYPEYRAMGDIDIMTSREDYTAACDMLIENGYIENTSDKTSEFGRHRGFIKNGIEVEVHAFFAMLNNPEEAHYLDEQIISHINPSHELPDMINGLTLLEHINQHLEDGLGLRQIIDWMMFVDKCVPDDQWAEFQTLAKNTGMEKLAIITTRMCEMYLGLPAHSWCAHADTNICKRLMEYILSCGNFGSKRMEENEAGAGVLVNASNPVAAFRLLQKRGAEHWKAAQTHRFLRSFAWIYQLFRYAIRGLSRKGATKKILNDYAIAKQRIELFDSLNVTQIAKGLAVYEDGKFKKTYKIP